MSRQIYSVKICQRLLYTETGELFSPFHYFPYDRLYLVKKKELPLIKRMFRYFFQLDVTQNIVDALDRVVINRVRTLKHQRDDATSEYIPINTSNMFGSFLTPDMPNWMLVVPTQVKTKKTEPLTSYINYVHSSLINRHGYPTPGNYLPPITLHTPQRTIHLLCAICDNILKYQTGDCSPGTPSCRARSNQSIQLEHDTYFSNKYKTREP